MAGPKIQRNTFTTELPISGSKVHYRAYTVREEKILLLVKDSDDADAFFNAVVQVVNNCVVSPEDLDPETIPYVDLEWIFLHIRAASVSNTIEVSFRDQEDDEVRDFKIDINEIGVKKSDEHVKEFSIVDGDYTVTMKYPTIKMLRGLRIKDMESMENDPSLLFDMIASCVDTVYEKKTERLYERMGIKDSTEFIADFSREEMVHIENFFATMPAIEHVIEFVNKNGTKRRIVLRGMKDFFY